MRLLIVFALLSLSLCQVEDLRSDTGGILNGIWASEERLMLIIEQTNYFLNATLITLCFPKYNVKGSITKNNTFYLDGAFNTTTTAITGQLFEINQYKTLKIILMKYDYTNCTKYTPAKTSFYELTPRSIIPNSMTTQASYNWFNYVAENFNEKDANCSLEGTWYNDLGSTMVVKQNEDGLLEGEYHTAVESHNGSSGGFKTKVYGAISPYSVFSFSLVWNEGTSISSFVGQCIPSSNNATFLKTQWTMLVGQETFDTSWNAIYNGMNNFYKEKPFANNWSSEDGLGIHFKGPNNALTAEVVIPCGQQYSVKGTRTNDNIFYLYGATKSTAIGITGLFFRTKEGQILKITLMQYDCTNCPGYTPTNISAHELKPNETITYKTEPQIHQDASSCNLNGTWHNELGSSMTITQKDDGSLEGIYYFKEVSKQTLLYGTISLSLFSFGIVWDEESSVIVFTGQCIPLVGYETTLYTKWSLVTAQKSVETSWDAFQTGMNNFYQDSITK